jgi:NAD-dependent dihydropyrimidine dehydrogenase PreA subunit
MEPMDDPLLLTDNMPFIAHKGALWLKMTTRGVSAHGSMPDQGVNAIYKATTLVDKLRQFSFHGASHPILGKPTLNVGSLSGGTKITRTTNTVLFRRYAKQGRSILRSFAGGVVSEGSARGRILGSDAPSHAMPRRPLKGEEMGLYQELSNRIGLGDSEIVPTLFEMLADKTDARILLSLPSTAAEIAEKIGCSGHEIEKRLQDLFLKGVVFFSTRTTPPSYRMCRDIVQFHDASILWKDASRQFLDVWQEFMEKEWPDLARRINQMTDKPYTRVIPVNVSVEAKTHILDSESVSGIVSKAQHLAVTNCTCRLTAKKCDHPLEVCIQVNNAALYSINRGTGRRIKEEEALAILRDAEEKGLIHVTMNRQKVDHFICNCCPCCCQTMPILIKGGIRVIDPSRFAATIDPERCNGCGTCHQRCYFGAISWVDDEGGVSTVKSHKCMGCGLCRVTCPQDAISMVEIRPESFVP